MPSLFTMYKYGKPRRRNARWYVHAHTGCWIWQGRTLRGYGIWQDRMAHRVIYELEAGPIPEGLQLHHTCFTKDCVNPDHLQVVTPAEHSKLHSNG